MAGSTAPGPADPTTLRGRTEPWGPFGLAVLTVLLAVGLWFRLRGLAAEGFADDEVHKWLAANRYLAGDFGGDDVEHPMLMKSLAALAVWALRDALAPEALTRLPSALAGGLTVVATALLGRRLFGRAAGLLAAAFVAVSTTAIGYHRIAKEDALLGLFFVLSVWCLAEARAAAEDVRDGDARRWELASAAALGAAFASKYFIFYFPIPVLSYLWLRPVSRWRVPLARWAALIGFALAVFLALNFTPLFPSTYAYLGHYIRGDAVGGDRGVSESIVFMGRLHGNLGLRGDAPPPWYFLVFAAVKFAPATALLGFAGLALALARRRPSHRIALAWLGIFWLAFQMAGAKYGRFFVSAMPAFLALAGHAAAEAARAIASRVAPLREGATPRFAAATAALLLVLPEARAAVTHAPHHRLYVSALGGGDRNVTWFFPHCDYFDAGFREAMAWVSAFAPAGAEVASEVDWTVRFYAGARGRSDLVSRPVLAGKSCSGAKPCFVLVQPGRLYRHSELAVARLAAKAPAHVVRIRGEDAVRVYELAPGEGLFPSDAAAAQVLRPGGG
jgi:4-amino-4-deoxy-L-arabinose transferase-like glycosyltransferase